MRVGSSLVGLLWLFSCVAGAQPTDTMRWATAAFTVTSAARTESGPALSLRRQDHGRLEFGRSVIQTPLKIGTKDFKHGLGTHANSEIVVTLPPTAKTFKAFAGVDNNADTQGKFGTVAF